jgi:Flp pilus assembly pilin Flp
VAVITNSAAGDCGKVPRAFEPRRSLRAQASVTLPLAAKDIDRGLGLQSEPTGLNKRSARTSRTGDPAEMPRRHAQATMVKARLQSDGGQTFVEYTLILAVVVVATMLAVSATPLGNAIQNAVTQVAAAF